MKVKVELVYANPARLVPKEVEIRDGLKGIRFMNAIDKAVKKIDEEWTRWNLMEILDD